MTLFQTRKILSMEFSVLKDCCKRHLIAPTGLEPVYSIAVRNTSVIAVMFPPVYHNRQSGQRRGTDSNRRHMPWIGMRLLLRSLTWSAYSYHCSTIWATSPCGTSYWFVRTFVPSPWLERVGFEPTMKQAPSCKICCQHHKHDVLYITAASTVPPSLHIQF